MPKRKRCEAHQGADLKALLAAAPLDGIELDRSRDPVRDAGGNSKREGGEGDESNGTKHLDRAPHFARFSLS